MAGRHGMKKNYLIFGILMVVTSCSNFWNDRIETGLFVPDISYKIVKNSYNSYYEVEIECSQKNRFASYNVYCATTEDGNFKLVKNYPSYQSMSMEIQQGKVYLFKAQSVYNKKTSGFSKVIEVKVFDGVPENIQVEKIDSKYMKITWDPVEGAIGYEVEVTGRYSTGRTEICEYTCPLSDSGTIYINAVFNDYFGARTKFDYSL